MPDTSEPLLLALISLAGRTAFPVENLREIVSPAGSAGEKQRQAFNLCDGTRGQGEIAKMLKIDQGSFSRTVARWIDEGVMFRIGEGRDARLRHVYPLPERLPNKKRK